jgi:hypothetical protein
MPHEAHSGRKLRKVSWGIMEKGTVGSVEAMTVVIAMVHT